MSLRIPGANRRAYDRATREARRIGEETRREIRRIARAEQLPPTPLGRAQVRAEQAAAVMAAVVAIAETITQLRKLFHEVRTPLDMSQVPPEPVTD